MRLLSVTHIRTYILVSIFFTLFLSTYSLGETKSRFEISYLKASNKKEQEVKKWIKESSEIKLVTSLINQKLKLNQSLELKFGGEEGPLFDNGINKVLIPYGFLIEVQERFQKAKYLDETGITNKEASMDALMHTIFHELAHALIFQYDLPVLGKEEDAADGLASVLLIEFLEDGQEVVITAADLFDLEGQDITEYQVEDYWGEHSLDIQRYYSSLCHVYGSAPEKYKQIKTDEKFSNEKAENCIDDYDILVNSWFTLLAPFLRK